MKEKLIKNTSNPNVISLSPNIISSISKIALSEKSVPKQKKDVPNCPEYPSWVQDRLYLSWDFFPNPEKFESVSI